MNFTISTLTSNIKRHLSAIGKRLYTKEGKNLFSDITLSSAEDTSLLSQYINSSAQDIEGNLKQFITSSSYSSSVISITITNTRGDGDFDARAQAISESFITLNAVACYLSMLHPDLAAKYHEDAGRKMDSLIQYVTFKKPPTAAAFSYNDITGTIN